MLKSKFCSSSYSTRQFPKPKLSMNANFVTYINATIENNKTIKKSLSKLVVNIISVFDKSYCYLDNLSTKSMHLLTQPRCDILPTKEDTGRQETQKIESKILNWDWLLSLHSYSLAKHYCFTKHTLISGFIYSHN